MRLVARECGRDQTGKVNKQAASLATRIIPALTASLILFSLPSVSCSRTTLGQHLLTQSRHHAAAVRSLFLSYLVLFTYILYLFNGSFTLQNSDTAARMYIRPPSCSSRRASLSITKVSPLYFPVCVPLGSRLVGCPRRLGQSPALALLSLSSLFFLLLLGQHSHSRSIKLWLHCSLFFKPLCVRVKWLPGSRLPVYLALVSGHHINSC
jgi:hypothetical protein